MMAGRLPAAAVRIGVRPLGRSIWAESDNHTSLQDPEIARVSGRLTFGRVALGGCPPRAPTDPDVRD
jgi:hypothetical protein